MRGNDELCMLIPISYLIDLRYSCRLVNLSVEALGGQLSGLPAELVTAQLILERICNGYEQTYGLIDSLQSQEGGLGSFHGE